MKFINYLIICFGGLFCVTGTLLVLAYVWEAVILRWGEGDQSLVFWYLPFLLFGLIGIISGIALIGFGKGRLNRRHGKQKKQITQSN